MTKRLTNLEPFEISLVPNGANKKRFLVMKEDHSRSLLDRVLKTFGKKDDEDKINEKLDGLSPAAQTAARAIARIAAPHADELNADHVNAMLAQAGIDGVDEESSEGSMKDVKPEHMKAAKAKAEKAYKEEMEKLGYAKYPSGELQMKEVSDNAEKSKKKDDEDEDEDEEMEKAKAEKAKKEKAMKEFIKADGTFDTAAILKSADADPMLVVIAKMQEQSEARVKLAETRAENAEKIMKEHKEATTKSEIVRKSFEFKNLSQPYCQQMLELAHTAGGEKYEQVVKSLEAQNAQLAQSGLFNELGGAGMSDGAMSSWGKIEKAAEGIVQKSGEKISKEMAIADFLSTDEGQKLYAQHQAARPNGI